MYLIARLLLIITLLELFLGGGGRVFEVYGTTLRILLFALNIMVSLFIIDFNRRILNDVVVICLSVLFILIFHLFIGVFNGADISLVYEDIKPLSYFFSILIFGTYINTKERVNLVVKLLKKTSLLMAICYLFIQLLFYIDYLEFNSFWNYVNFHVSGSDFFFRGTKGLFFYKGFLYMTLGSIFWMLVDYKKKSMISIIIILLAMIASGSRGFVLMYAVLFALYYGVPLLLRFNLKIIILSVVLLILGSYFFLNVELGNKNLSDSIRILQIQQVLTNINIFSFFIGHGFGVGVPIRPIHMEIGYLEVFHKQGMFGLFSWGIFIIYIYNQFKAYNNFVNIRKAFFLGILFVLFVSLTNPFFNNPIGISFFAVALASYWVLNKMASEDELAFLNEK